MESEISLPFITADASGPKHLQMKLSRSKFEQMVQDILDRTLKPCEMAVRDAGIPVGEIDEVVLVGGSTRIPKVVEMVKKFFGKDPHQGVNPDEVVAAGAAVQAGVLGGEVKDLLLLDVTPAVAGDRDAGRRDDQAHRAQLHDSDAQERGLHHGGGQPAERRDPRPAGGAGRWRRTTVRWGGSIWTGSRRHPAASRRSRLPSTSTRTASST